MRKEPFKSFTLSIPLLVVFGCNKANVNHDLIAMSEEVHANQPVAESYEPIGLENEAKTVDSPVIMLPPIPEDLIPPRPIKAHPTQALIGGGGGGGFVSHFILSDIRSFDGSENHPDDLGKGAEGDNQQILNTTFLPSANFEIRTDIHILATMASALERVLPAKYLDDGNTPDADTLPHPRLVSNTIFAQEGSIKNLAELSQITTIWGQFLDHDMSFAPLGLDKSFPIPPYPDPMTENGVEFFRSLNVESSGNEETPRMQYNLLTSFIDGSQIYGSSKERSDWLRSHRNGEMKISSGKFLPFGLENASSPSMAGLIENPNLSSLADLYVAGDIRANENLALLAMHTIFVREHNRIAKELRAKALLKDDELIFQAARKIVGALLQSITYNEFLPALGIEIPPYQGYDATADPRITNVFSTAGFRFGHTMVAEKIPMKLADGEMSFLPLTFTFFNPSFLDEVTLAGVFGGAANSLSERIDHKIVDAIRNLLFTPPGAHFGLDLAMVNIQRARDHGLPSYVQARSLFDGENYISPELQSLLLTIYPSIEDVEIWVGMLCEPELPGSAVGQTIHDILSMQFAKLRDGDRFFYLMDKDFSSNHMLGKLGFDLKYIENRTLSKIIIDNTELTPNEISDNAFKVPTIPLSVP